MATPAQGEAIPQPPSGFAMAPSAPERASLDRRKKLIRRTDRDYSQLLRRSFQFVFLAWNVYMGGLFYVWVRHFETGSHTRFVSRPAGVEGWLPIAGLMNFKYLLVTGHVPTIHPAAMFLLITFLSIAFLLRKAFCGWLCPVGTVAEYLWRAGRKLLGRNFHLPTWIDIPLRGLKYALLGFFVWAVSSMSADAIAGFMGSPYGMIADVKMLNFFRHIGETGAIVLGILVVASIFIQNFWCRYLCPYGALLGLTSFFSPLRIRRSELACIDCGKCAKACPSALRVDELMSIKSAECTGCMECIAACPAEGALRIALPAGESNKGRMPAWAMAAGLAFLFLGVVGYAKAAGYWKTEVPRSVYMELVPHADEAAHPMPGDPGLQ